MQFSDSLRQSAKTAGNGVNLDEFDVSLVDTAVHTAARVTIEHVVASIQCQRVGLKSKRLMIAMNALE